jgi:polar amino acid transport system substrate-binding protein
VNWLKALALLGFLALTPPALGADPLRVGIRPAPPFVIIPEPNQYSGVEIDLWEQIAQGQDLEYQYLVYEDLEQGLQALKAGQLDLFFGAVPITAETLAQVNFSQPYHQSRPALLLRAEPPNPLALLHPLLRIAIGGGFIAFLCLHTLFAHLIWLAERRCNPEQFPPHYARGIREALWFTSVTMTTVGYGDKVPLTPAGRRLSFVWMWVGMALTSSLTAGIASGLTLSFSQELTAEFNHRQLLAQTKVAVPRQTLIPPALKGYPVRLVLTDSQTQALELLRRRQVEGLFGYADALRYWQSRVNQPATRFVPLPVPPVGYGFALGVKFPLTRRLNVALSQKQESGELELLLNRYLPLPGNPGRNPN